MQKNSSFSIRRKKVNRLLFFIISLLICSTILVCAVNNKQNNHGPYKPPTTVNPKAIVKKSKNEYTNIDEIVVNEEEWYLNLVNKWNPIKSDSDIEMTKLLNGEHVDKRIYPDLQKMFDAARNDGVYPIVTSGYRTEREQTEIYNKKITSCKEDGLSDDEAKKEAELWVAIPGTSEHQLGLAVDINAEKEKCSNNDVYKWLVKNSYKYGFILRYPTNKVEITGVAYELWHYRYVGKKVAKEIYNSNICLEEYLEKIN